MVVSIRAEKRAQTVQLTPQQFSLIVGRRIGETFDGSAFGFKGVDLKVTGGTDVDGFPMRPDVSGQRKARILLTEGIGFHPREKPPSKSKKKRNRRRVKGMRKSVIVRGNMIGEEISQVNVVTVPKEESGR